MKLELVVLTTVISLFGSSKAGSNGLYNNPISTIKYVPGKVEPNDLKLFLVECTNDCIVHAIETFNGTGKDIQLRSTKYTDIEYFDCDEWGQFYGGTTNVRCAKDWDDKVFKYGKNTFYIWLRAVNGESFEDVNLKVTLERSIATITEVVPPSVAVRKDKSGNEYVEVKSGTAEELKDLTYRHVGVECSGNCKGIKFSSEGGSGNVKLFGSEGGPALILKKACINNCICESNNPGNVDVCELPDGKEKFDLNSNFFWIVLEPNPSFKDVAAKVTGDNIVKVHEIKNITFQSAKLTDGTFVIATVALRTKGSTAHFYLDGNKRYPTDVRFQVFGAGKGEFEIRAGPNTQKLNDGTCPKCVCHGMCDQPFAPGKVHTGVTIEALKGIGGILYIKVYGKGILNFKHASFVPDGNYLRYTDWTWG